LRISLVKTFHKDILIVKEILKVDEIVRQWMRKKKRSMHRHEGKGEK